MTDTNPTTTPETTETHTTQDTHNTPTPETTETKPETTPQTTNTDQLPDDPQQLKNIIHRLRGENAKSRTDAKVRAAEEARADLIHDLGKALGLVGDSEETPSVETLTESLTQAQGEAEQARKALAVYRAARGVADADALLDSRAFDGVLNGVDLADEGAVKTAITSFVAEYPRFRSAQVAGASSVEYPAGSGEGAVTLDQFKRMSGEERNRLYATNPNLYRQFAAHA